MLTPEQLDPLAMAYAKAADGIGCERGSFLYDEVVRGLQGMFQVMMDAGWRILPPGHVAWPQNHAEAAAMNCVSELALKNSAGQ